MELAKITGEVDGTSLRVRMRSGVHLYAPMITLGSMSVPSQQWLKDNKDSFLAVIDFMMDDYSDPICLGFFPVNSASTEVYNITERVLSVLEKLLDQLTKGKVNTQIGPQGFMPDTLQVLNNLSDDVKELRKLTYKEE